MQEITPPKLPSQQALWLVAQGWSQSSLPRRVNNSSNLLLNLKYHPLRLKSTSTPLRTNSMSIWSILETSCSIIQLQRSQIIPVRMFFRIVQTTIITISNRSRQRRGNYPKRFLRRALSLMRTKISQRVWLFKAKTFSHLARWPKTL